MSEQTPVSRQKIIYLVAGILLGFAAGFALANGINREEQGRLRAEVTRLRAGPADGARAEGKSNASAEGDDLFPALTEEQLQNAVARADESPRDAELQRKAGQALYLYAMQTGTSSIMPDVARILRRAHEADPDDYQTTVLAGNASFLVARGGGDAKFMAEARKLYERALQEKPDDVDVRTTLGLTYFYGEPSDPRRAIREYRRALETDPRHEMTLQSLASALIESGDFEEAERRLKELEGVNATSGELANLRAQLEQKRNAAKERE